MQFVESLKKTSSISDLSYIRFEVFVAKMVKAVSKARKMYQELPCYYAYSSIRV